MMIIFESKRYKYYMMDIFSPHDWIEVDEDAFNSIVVKYRSLYKMAYGKNGNERLFYRIENNKTMEDPEFKVVTVGTKLIKL